MSVLLATALVGFTAPAGLSSRGIGSHANRVAVPVVLSLLKAEGTPDQIDNLFSQAETAMGVVCLACTQPQHMLSNLVFARAAETYASSMLYGGQPGLASIMAARAREMGKASDMPRMMRVTILANACGAAVGGLAMPYIFELAGYDILFVLGGVAMLLGAVVTLPRRVPG